ncbi:MAG: potassium-transporting ATPase subunit KdpC [Bacteroidota bacterium]
MKTLLISLKIFLFFTVLTGIIYPLAVTGIAQALFPSKANGSLIKRGNRTIGSELIGQQFEAAKYFMSRPSAVAYNPLPSGGSNYGLTNSKLKKLVIKRRDQFLAMNRLDRGANIPSEILFASASGIDPHISPQAALLQVARISKFRNFNLEQEQKLRQYLRDLTELPQFLCLGEPRMNVLLLNLKLDEIK